MNDLRAELVKRFFYDPRTGLFSRWDGKPFRSYKDSSGHLHTSINKRRVPLSHAAWLIVYGYLPPDQVDHKNCCATDNRIKNLRLATGQQNRCNVPLRADNTSGFKGVSHHCKSDLWRARINKNGKTFLLGLFKTPEEAHEAYKQAARKLHGEFANHG